MHDAAPQVTRLLLVDDHVLLREGLQHYLDGKSDLQVVGACGTVQEALSFVQTDSVDMVLLDIGLGSENGAEFLSRAPLLGFQGRILLVTAGVSDAEAVKLLHLGASGVFLKNRPVLELADCIRRTMARDAAAHDANTRELIGTLQGSAAPSRTELTPREKQTLRLIFQGAANKEIADQLNISESSAKAILQQLFAKTGVRTRGQLVRVAVEHYWDQLAR